MVTNSRWSQTLSKARKITKKLFVSLYGVQDLVWLAVLLKIESLKKIKKKSRAYLQHTYFIKEHIQLLEDGGMQTFPNF